MSKAFGWIPLPASTGFARVAATAFLLYAAGSGATGVQARPAAPAEDSKTVVALTDRGRQRPARFGLRRDPARTSTAEDALRLRLRLRSGWQTYTAPTRLASSAGAATWLRLDLRNDSQVGEYVVELSAPDTSHAEAFQFHNNRWIPLRIVGVAQAGDAGRRETSRRVTVSFYAPPGENCILLVRIPGNQSTLIDPILYAAEDAADDLRFAFIARGLCCGLLLLALAFNLSLYMAARDPGNLWLAGSALAAALSYGLAADFAAPVPGSDGSFATINYSAILASLALVCALGFSANRMAKLIRLPGARRLTEIGWRSNAPGARPIALGWGALLCGILCFQAYNFGVVKVSLLQHAPLVGAGLGLLFLHLASLNSILATGKSAERNESASERVQAGPPGEARLRGLCRAACVAELRRLMEVEHLYCDEDLSLARLAQALEVRPDQLSLLLNQELHTGFTDFVNSYRTQAARRMLAAEPERSVPSIACAVGFNTRSAFYQAFRKFTGKTPGDFRRRPAPSAVGRTKQAGASALLHGQGEAAAL